MSLESRIMELESRLAFQDDTIQALSDELVEQHKRIERLQRTPLGHFQLYLKGMGEEALIVSRRHVAGVRKLMHHL